MLYIKNAEEIKIMRESNRIVAELLIRIESLIKPGVSTWELDQFAEDYILSQGGKPAFKGYQVDGLAPYPSAICASVNDCIVHGIPSKTTILKEGDIIGIDVGVKKNGFYGDAAKTYKVGSVSIKAQRLMDITLKALDIGISVAKNGARVGDIAYAIGSFVMDNGLFVADKLAGHGVGKELHEEPTVPNIGYKGKGIRLKKGMTIAIEPMVNEGTNKVKEIGWEYFVADNSLSAHFEHTILITDGDPELLTII